MIYVREENWEEEFGKVGLMVGKKVRDIVEALIASVKERELERAVEHINEMRDEIDIEQARKGRL